MQKIPADFSLKELCNKEGITTSFSLNLIKNRSAIHITQVAPNKLALFDKTVYMETKGGNMDDHDRQYIDKLHLQKCIMPDNIARKLHNFDEETGGAENQHILLSKTQDFRVLVHGDCFVSNNIPGALWKYQTASDRTKFYGHGMGQYSYYCYGYIFKSSDIKQAKFIDVGIGRKQIRSIECTGQSSLPVKPSRCYKITYNGKGIKNATATWVPL
jgi:hypothetical protein